MLCNKRCHIPSFELWDDSTQLLIWKYMESLAEDREVKRRKTHSLAQTNVL